MDYTLRFLAGGLIVSMFAILGDMLRPKSKQPGKVSVSANTGITLAARDGELMRRHSMPGARRSAASA
jgi:hypothetical protein